jgi:hypothetical protein
LAGAYAVAAMRLSETTLGIGVQLMELDNFDLDSNVYFKLDPLLLCCISAIVQIAMASGTVTIEKAYFETLLRR